MTMYYFFDIFTDLWGAIGALAATLVGGAGVLCVLIVQILITFVVLVFLGATAYHLWFLVCKSMATLMHKDSKKQKWFEEKYLDIKYPSRVRRRQNKRHLGTE